jgi:hypothetical protein
MSLRKITQNAARPISVKINTKLFPWEKNFPQSLGYFFIYKKLLKENSRKFAQSGHPESIFIF